MPRDAIANELRAALLAYAQAVLYLTSRLPPNNPICAPQPTFAKML